MTSTDISLRKEEKEQVFQSGPISTVIGGHFVHDTFTAFIAPLLPLVIEKLSLSLTLVGTLTAFMQFPAILNPFIGYLADKISLRYFVIFAPAVTATLIGMMGFAPNYVTLALLFVLIGISVAAFHAPTPAMIARVAGNRVGFGMSLYMAAGELGRTVGPLVAVSAVAAWGLDGLYRLVVIGWTASGIMLWRFRSISSSEYRKKASSLREILPRMGSLFLPVIFIALSRSFLTVSITTYLPTFLNFEGSSLIRAGILLSILEGAGVVGALLSGTVSDKFGRKPILLAADPGTGLARIFQPSPPASTVSLGAGSPAQPPGGSQRTVYVHQLSAEIVGAGADRDCWRRMGPAHYLHHQCCHLDPLGHPDPVAAGGR